MSRVPSLSSPFLLGFDEIERALDRVVKGADGYPPYNIERLNREDGQPERLRITLAVAGFTRDQLDVCTEENQLVIRGRQQDDKARTFIHRHRRAPLPAHLRAGRRGWRSSARTSRTDCFRSIWPGRNRSGSLRR